MSDLTRRRFKVPEEPSSDLTRRRFFFLGASAGLITVLPPGWVKGLIHQDPWTIKAIHWKWLTEDSFFPMSDGTIIVGSWWTKKDLHEIVLNGVEGSD